jgi:hypothetical protein
MLVTPTPSANNALPFRVLRDVERRGDATLWGSGFVIPVFHALRCHNLEPAWVVLDHEATPTTDAIDGAADALVRDGVLTDAAKSWDIFERLHDWKVLPRAMREAHAPDALKTPGAAASAAVLAFNNWAHALTREALQRAVVKHARALFRTPPRVVNYGDGWHSVSGGRVYTALTRCRSPVCYHGGNPSHWPERENVNNAEVLDALRTAGASRVLPVYGLPGFGDTDADGKGPGFATWAAFVNTHRVGGVRQSWLFNPRTPVMTTTQKMWTSEAEVSVARWLREVNA